ncbi:DapH/DapD/GlmU-related protein [Antarcticimicrobium sediminis]|uniref:Chloramphenicol acetyltransferase n=1 Tax=Antarcticimicrobium sediminis TaxID=2546227 RepID=A0A4R5EVQ0_9RHOB|nr:DapH/DapD/GlmU-related protein [Antarcticimicrobium sediminis]TDE39058.1 chloramphenicol acetyltransferase [Antarcticimicrobium sediminis]
MPRLSPSEPVIHPDCEVVNTSFGAYCELGRGSRVQNSTFGDYSYTDRASDIANATIGKFANIASYTRIGPTDHPLDTASLHHFLYRSSDYWDDVALDPEFFEHRASRRALIGHDTWLGHNCIIKPEVTVGDGAVVASGAVVTRDVAPYTIVAGMPAKPMRLRQPPEIAARLIALGWWDWDHARLRAALPDFRSLSAEAFLEKYE